MTRPISSAARIAMFGQETGEVFLLLLTISHADLAAPIRVVNNSENVTSDGEEYIAFPFKIDMPPDRDDLPPRVRIQIDNVDRTIVTALRTIQSAPTIALSVILASQPDTVEAGPFTFTLKDASYSALIVEGELAYEDTLNEPYPSDTFSPNHFPGLFQ